MLNWACKICEKIKARTRGKIVYTYTRYSMNNYSA
jgi:hypothetical protein